ncbi:hypothetical protein ACHAXR_003668, partial [Thalassiosira sp. AJA248-18]
EQADNSSSSHDSNSPKNFLTSSNTKIPISVNSSSTDAGAVPKEDDEFDADIDMVDFFAKSHQQHQPPSSKKGTIATDDHMPGDVVVSSDGGSGTKNPNTNDHTSKKSSSPGGTNLMSSLDAFEASFASAFPETSFSITTSGGNGSSDPSSASYPLSFPSAKLDMSFDVPDTFDPFFKSPSNANNSSASSVSSHGGSVGGGGLSKNNITSKDNSSMIQDLFPESYSSLGIPTKKKLDSGRKTVATTTTTALAFDPPSNNSGMSFAPTAMETNETRKGSGSSGSAGGVALSRVLAQQPRAKGTVTGSAINQPLSPQSMSAEIEQLDVIANLASSNLLEKKTPSESKKNATNSDNGNATNSDNGVGTTTASAAASGNSNNLHPNNNTITSSTHRTSTSATTTTATRLSTRKVKQPVSYAEPSTKSKLRRGDVLFPKKADAASGSAADKKVKNKSPATDLDRIMGQMSDNGE